MSENLGKGDTGTSITSVGNVPATSASALGQQAFSVPTGPPPDYEDRQLPPGWVKEFDPRSERHYYVDTMAKPPRSIWVHPFEDPQFLRSAGISSRDLSDDDHSSSEDHHPRPISPSPGSFRPDSKDPHSSSKSNSDYLSVPGASTSSPASSSVRTSSSTNEGKQKERGFFGRLKDSAIGTKEERAARKLERKRERERVRAEREQRHREEERRFIEARNRYVAERQRMVEEEREAYRRQGIPYPNYGDGYSGAPHPGAYGGPVYMPQYGYGQSPYGRRGGVGGGTALLGGLLGGLLLGDILF